MKSFPVLHFVRLSVLTQILHSLTFDQARLRDVVSGSDSATFIHTHLSKLRNKSPQASHNRDVKLIGVFGYCQMTLFFT